ncbi:STAS domain-containing protein [Streptomyces sp. NPDC089424]|uniref:STAS domain-containing protein n=1 Tax=Streptomyces sp. NPDC089424 TaxID=3365917 RepID=UPI0038198BDE
MSTDLRVNINEEADGHLAVVSVSGELDMQTSTAVYQQTAAPISEHVTVVLDLSQVTFCDSSGFNALLRLRRRAQEAGSRLALAAPPPQVDRLLTLTGAGTVFPVYRSLAQALAHESSRHDES